MTYTGNPRLWPVGLYACTKHGDCILVVVIDNKTALSGVSISTLHMLSPSENCSFYYTRIGDL